MKIIKDKVHTRGISCINTGQPFSTLASSVVTGSYEGTAKVWDTRTAREESRITLANTIHTENSEPVTSVVFSNPYLPYKYIGNPCVEISNTTEESNKRLYAEKCEYLMSRSEFSIFLGSNNRVYEYDLRNGEVINSYISVSDRFSDEVSFLTCSPDGHEIAACNDDGTVSYISLYADKPLSNILNPSPDSPNQLTPHTVKQAHKSMCNVAIYDPFAPYTLHDRARYSTLTCGMDMTLKYWTSGNVIQHSLGLKLPLNVDEHCYIHSFNARQIGNQILNPPVVQCLTMSSCGSAVFAGCGDGSVGVYMPKRRYNDGVLNKLRYYAHLFDEHLEDPAASLSSEFNLEEFQSVSQYRYIHPSSPSPSPSSQNSPSHHSPSTNLGKYGKPIHLMSFTGHMNGVITVDCPKFMENYYSHSTAYRYAHHGLFGVSDRVNSTLLNTLGFTLNFNMNAESEKEDSESIGFYSNHEQQSMSYTINTSLRQQYLFQRKNYFDSSHNVNTNYSHGLFDGADVLLTASMDNSLVLWSGLKTLLWNGYIKTTSEVNMDEDKEIRWREDISSDINHISNLFQVNYDFTDEELYLNDSYTYNALVEGFVNEVDGYTNRPCSSDDEHNRLIDGIYNDFKPFMKDIVPVDLARCRIELSETPNCMTSDVNGWCWLGNTDGTISGYDLIKE